MFFLKKHTSLMTKLSFLFCFLLSSVLYANETNDGFALSAGNLSPINLGILDEGHSQMGTRIGYRFGRLQPFGFVDFARGSFINESTFEEGDGADLIKDTNKDNSTLTLITAGAGLKYLLKDPKAKSAQPYVVGSVFTVIPMATANDIDIKELDKATSWGALAGFGTQYSFSKHFSAGIELGLSYFTANYTYTTDDSYGTYLYRQTDQTGLGLWQLYHMLFVEIVL
jgi:hypothetical protein